MKSKLYNVIFPIWLIVYFPPIILLVIPGNFLIDLIMLLIILKILKQDNIKEMLKKHYLKVVALGFLADIIGSLLLFIAMFINPISNIAYNPYQNILSSLYLIIVFLITCFLIYLFNYKYNFKENQAKKISILLAILTAPYFFLIPTSALYPPMKTIDSYDNTSIKETSKINMMTYYFGELALEEISVDKEKYTITIDVSTEDDNYTNYKTLEENASLLFAMTTDLKNVIYKIEDKTYEFDYNYINQIYTNVRDKSSSDIYKRYVNDYFENYVYLGNVNGEYDLFDKSEKCNTELQTLYEDNYNKYLVSCSEIDELVVVKGNQEIKLTKALSNELFDIKMLSNTTLKIYREGK